MNNPLVEFRQVRKKYKNTLALDGLSFSVLPGEAVGLCGNNGCGKTTTVHILCNLMPYGSGDVFFDGQRVDHKYVSYKGRLGIVLSEPYYVEHFNLREYWTFVCRFQKVPKEQVKGRIDDLIGMLGLEAHAGKPIKALSSGNQMKVSLGGALIHNPEMLVLDEPFVNLDPQATADLTGLLKSLRGKKTLFVTSHQLELLAGLCSRFLVMGQGRLADTLNASDYPSEAALQDAMRKMLAKEPSPKGPAWLG